MAEEEVRSLGQQLMDNPSSIMQPGSAQPSQYPVSLADTEGRDCNEFDRLYFFYGSLMDSGNVAWILDLAKEPKLRPARIEGYRTMLWGPFPALIRADNQSVSGVTYRVESHAEVERQVTELQNVEGEDYERERVRILYDDDSWEWGWTFVWRGDMTELREGVFDLETWRSGAFEL
ncbi:MAG: hypothetical protein Q9172_007615 [Xanthocarpia lactea]